MQDEHPNYYITVSDIKPAFKTSDNLPVYTVPFRDTPYYLAVNRDTEERYDQACSATIGGFLCDDDDQRCFAFTAAHALVPEPEMQSLNDLFGKWEDLKSHNKQLQARLMVDHMDKRLVIRNHNSLDTMRVNQPLLFGAQIYFKSGIPYIIAECQQFMIDFLLLPVAPTRVFSRTDIRKPFDSINKFKGKNTLGALLHGDTDEYNIERYIDIKSKADIDLLRDERVAVFIAGQMGTLEVAPEVPPSHSEYSYGWHIAFKMDHAYVCPFFNLQIKTETIIEIAHMYTTSQTITVQFLAMRLHGHPLDCINLNELSLDPENYGEFACGRSKIYKVKL